MSLDYLAAQATLDRARAAGVALEATAEGLAFDATPEALAELIDDLRAHKAGILEILRDVAEIPPAGPEPWPEWALEDSWGPAEFPTESTAAGRFRRQAAELRSGKSPIPSTDGLPTNEPRPCARCGNAELNPTPCELGTRWECFAPTCRIAGDRARTWWLGRTIWIEGKEPGQ